MNHTPTPKATRATPHDVALYRLLCSGGLTQSQCRTIALAIGEAITQAYYTQERTTLVAAIAYALSHPDTPASVSEKLRAALDSTLGKDSA